MLNEERLERAERMVIERAMKFVDAREARPNAVTPLREYAALLAAVAILKRIHGDDRMLVRMGAVQI